MGNKWNQVKKNISNISEFKALLLRDDEAAIYLLNILVERYDLSETFLYKYFGWRPKKSGKREVRKKEFVDELEKRSGYKFIYFRARVKDNAYDCIRILKEVVEDKKATPYFLTTMGFFPHDLERIADDGITKLNNKKGVISEPKRNV